MELSEEQAEEVVNLIMRKLKEFGATEVLEGIEESRRLGLEEKVDLRPSGPSEYRLAKGDLKTLGTTRRRPPTNVELLGLVLERLEQRLVVLPSIAASIEEHLNAEVIWRIDRDFASPDTTADFSAKTLNPPDAQGVAELFHQVSKLVPRVAPRRDRNSING